MIFHTYTETMDVYPVTYRDDTIDIRVFTRPPIQAARVVPRHLWGAPHKRSVMCMAIATVIGSVGARPMGPAAWEAGA